MSTNDELHGLYFEDLHVGQTAVYARTLTETDIVLFAGVTGDNNPVHINEVFAQGTPFSGRIAHGMLTAAFISTVLGTKLPGPGAIYLSQTMRFKAPVRPGDTVHATVTVMSVDRAKARAVLATVCRVRDTVVIEGEAQVMTTSRARREAKAASAEASGTPAAGAAVAAP